MRDARARLTVNGVARTVSAPAMKRLLDVLREDLGLTGTKEGCGEGECGACSVVLDGRLVNSCLVPLKQVDGAAIETIESERFAAIQETFAERGAAQCGICTPGMILAAHALLIEIKRPSRAEIREALAGNICRCTGYQKIIDAVEVLGQLEL